MKRSIKLLKLSYALLEAVALISVKSRCTDGNRVDIIADKS